jgi:hypothetical protein
VCERERKNDANKSGLKSPIDESFQSGGVEFIVTSAFEDPNTGRLPGGRVYAKIKNPGSRESVYPVVLAV